MIECGCTLIIILEERLSIGGRGLQGGLKTGKGKEKKKTERKFRIGEMFHSHFPKY